MVRMKVKVVGLDQHTMKPVVVITDAEETGFIPIVIGHAEARAIREAAEGKKWDRPMTHDLLKNLLEVLQAKVEKIVINDLREDTYFARIHLRTSEQEMEVDARPSDAIALALRTKAPIYVSEEVASKAVIGNVRTEPDRELRAFRRFLKNVRPEDFERNLKG